MSDQERKQSSATDDENAAWIEHFLITSQHATGTADSLSITPEQFAIRCSLTITGLRYSE
ncbi:hypothetical protein [Vibrio sp. CAU 1672]|uniref:hypothetical protein n=1 Tax=Vibrio sp. CAU 1672 TaxID=3032594 RepID=UPI0023DCC49D|nr:hypothetical protein [Vibrio sp. CAU 1672]